MSKIVHTEMCSSTDGSPSPISEFCNSWRSNDVTQASGPFRAYACFSPTRLLSYCLIFVILDFSHTSNFRDSQFFRLHIPYLLD